MPKTKIGYQEQDEKYRNAIKHILVDTGKENICKLVGLSTSGLDLHRRKPGMVTLRELRALANTGRLTDEQIISFIRRD